MKPSKEIISRRFIVNGKVQGVFFRASTKKTADSLGVQGYAKNLPSGQVEVLAQGENAQVQTLMDWLYKGPRMAQVDSVVEVDSDTSLRVEGFKTI
jgi:acylphosphatase